MALGGYKFVGYHFSLPADYDGTDAQVIAQCLRLHKMKLKAFMESCTASGANWVFSETSGDASFESYGNVIYKLDADGFNYASFFRYGSDDAYYCILTCSNCSSDGSSGTLNLRTIYMYFISSTRYMCAGSNNFDSIGLSPITPSNLFSTNSTALYGRLTLFNNNSGTVNSGNSAFIYIFKTVNSHYFGYATKNKNIISLSSSNLQSFAAKVNGIGSLSLSSPNDTNNMFSVCNDVTEATTTATSYSIGSTNVQVSNRSGYPYDRDATTSGTSGRSAYCTILVPKKATMVTPTSSISYESANITCAFGRTTSDYVLNSDGITSKGSVDIDLLAVNWISGGSGIVPGNTYANGNYLCIHKKRSTDTSGNSYSGALYCGWDSSNPDIAAPTSWPEWV